MFLRFLFLLLAGSLFLEASGYPKPKSFTHAKKIFRQIDFDYVRTAFSNEEYMYDPTSCLSKLYLKNDPSTKVVVARIVPESLIGRNMECFTASICKNYDGSMFQGPRCCRRKNTLYKQYDKDIFNLMVIVENTPYLDITPPLHVRGNIARVYLYMNLTYKLNLKQSQLDLYETWNKEDGVDEKECKLYKTIYKIQGRENPWIKSACDTLVNKSSKDSEL